MYILIAFFAPILHSLSCIIDAHFSNSIFNKTTSLIFYATITNIIIIPFLFSFGTPTLPSWSSLTVIIIVAAIDVFYQIPYYIALRKVDTSITVALFSLGKVSVPIFAYFIVGEKLSIMQYVGFGIILLSSFLLNFNRKLLKLNIAFFLMLIVSLALSLASVLEKYSLKEIDFVTLMFWMALFSTLISFSFLFIKNIRLDIINTFPEYKKNISLFLSNEVLSQGGTLAMIVALSQIPVLTIKSINSSQSIFTLFLTFILYKIFGDKFKENLTRDKVIKKLISFIFIMFGIYLVLR